MNLRIASTLLSAVCFSFILRVVYSLPACQCNGQASTCDHQSGRCHCTTKGIIGDHCEKCDKVNHYYGDPVKESCLCELAIKIQPGTSE